MAAARIELDVWSDYVCPFCYLEMPELARVRERFGNTVTIRWRAFELRPDPVPTLDPNGEYLHRVWGQSVYPMAAARGMVLRLPPVQPRSRLAHETAAFAREEVRFDAVHEGLFRAFFQDGRDLAEVSVLKDVATGAGLDPDALDQALAQGRYTAGVLAEEDLARRLGLSGVPATVVGRTGEGGRVVVSGAQPADVLEQAVRRFT